MGELDKCPCPGEHTVGGQRNRCFDCGEWCYNTVTNRSLCTRGWGIELRVSVEVLVRAYEDGAKRKTLKPLIEALKERAVY